MIAQHLHSSEPDMECEVQTKEYINLTERALDQVVVVCVSNGPCINFVTFFILTEVPSKAVLTRNTVCSNPRRV